MKDIGTEQSSIILNFMQSLHLLDSLQEFFGYYQLVLLWEA